MYHSIRQSMYFHNMDVVKIKFDNSFCYIIQLFKPSFVLSCIFIGSIVFMQIKKVPLCFLEVGQCFRKV